MGEFPSSERLGERFLFIENMQAVADANSLRLLDADTSICPTIELRLYDGHTPGQIVPYIHTEDRTFVFAGDVIPLVASVSPEWISAYDTYPVTSYNEKLRMLAEASRKGKRSSTAMTLTSAAQP